MKLSMVSTAGALAKRLDRLARSDLPFVASQALNDTARDVHGDLSDHIGEVFESPTRFTQNAFFIWYANKRTLTAEIRRKTNVAKRHYLEVQAEGGTRPATGLERGFQSQVKSGSAVRTVTPTRAAKKDRHGNWSRGQRNQVLRGLKGEGKGRVGYFTAPPDGALSPGVYRRDKTGGVTKILHFSDRPARYAQRFDPQAVAEARVPRRYPDHFRKRLTALLKG